MMRFGLRGVAAVLAAAAAAGACGDETLIYPGGAAGPAVRIEVSNSALLLNAGVPVTIGMRTVDDAGNPASAVPAISSCDGAVVGVASGTGAGQWTATATVTGVTIGDACLVVTVGSLPPESILVRVTPAALAIVGPGQILSGGTGAYALEFRHADGSVLTAPTGFPIPTVETLNDLRLPITATSDVDYDAAGQQPGFVGLRAALEGAWGGVVGNKVVEVVPGAFGGTLSAASAAPGSVVTVTRAAGGPAFDTDSKAALDGVGAYVDAFTADALTFAVPATGSTAAGTLLLSDMGSLQLAQTIGFTATKATEDVYAPGNTNTTVTPPAGAPDAATVMTANNNIYLVHGGFGAGSAARGAWNGGAQVDRYVAVTTGADSAVVTITLSWTNGSDVDLFILDGAGDEVDNSFSGSTTQEVLTFTFPASTTHYIGMSMWDAGSVITNLKLHLEGL